MTAEMQPSKRIICPACAGKGQEAHIYSFKSRRRNDAPEGQLRRLQTCAVCGGEGWVNQAALDAWTQVQALPECPVCKGQGGKYYWEWVESETGTRKQFYFEACSLCGGAKHVRPEQMAAHERERRKIRLWGVGCAAVAVVGGLFAVTQVVSLVVYQTPWVQCCAPPHIVFVSSSLLMTRGIRWLR